MTRKRQPISSNRNLRKTITNPLSFKTKLEKIDLFKTSKSDLEKELEKQRKAAEKSFRDSKTAMEFRFNQGREGVVSDVRKKTRSFLAQGLEEKLQSKLREIEGKARKLYELRTMASNDPELGKKISETADSLRNSQKQLEEIDDENYKKTRDLFFDETLINPSIERKRTSRKSSRDFRRV